MKLMRILYEVALDAFNGFVYFIKNNLINFANVLSIILPFAMYIVGQFAAINNYALDEKRIIIDVEIYIPIITLFIVYCLKSIANKIGKGITVPIPDKRFTQVDDDGEVSIEHNRLQELLLYTADLEDWFEKKGLI